MREKEEGATFRELWGFELISRVSMHQDPAVVQASGRKTPGVGCFANFISMHNQAELGSQLEPWYLRTNAQTQMHAALNAAIVCIVASAHPGCFHSSNLGNALCPKVLQRCLS